ncbi:MAG: HAMP domain-containing histidine kinase [Actinomycetota bacterium]|nr:HAMP domain-containing histidine kinase [Actinomycetota bacterium]
MRRRLTFAIVGVVAGALLVAGLGSLLLVRRAAGDETRAELVRQAQAVAQGAEEARRPGVVGVLRQVLRLEGFSVVRLSPDGRTLDAPPSGLTEDDLDAGRLLGGETVSGVHGSTAYAAAPIRGPARAPLAVVLTRQVSGVRRGSGYFALAAGLALAVAAAVADRVGRRIADPLARAEEATRHIAAGDLSARVPDGGRSYPELASLSHSINAMAADLDRARSQERQFLLSVSHDLRTPLTSIRGFAEAIADGVTADSRRAAEVIGAEAGRLERLVADLLELANLEARRFSLAVSRVDAAEVVSHTTEGFGPAAASAGVELCLDVPAAGPLVATADPDRLAQVVANLVENALKFARSRIDVAAGAGPDGVVVSVSDDGPGIPEEDLPQVFDRLSHSARGTPARQLGSGLGLAIVADLVAAMDGRVEAYSRSGATRMVVTLPGEAGMEAGPGAAGPPRA